MKKNIEESGVTYYDYNMEQYSFIELLQNLFQIEKLQDIHTTLDKGSISKIDTALFTNKNDDQTIFHKTFYNKINNGWPKFEEIYINFIRKLANEIYNTDEIIFQTKPTFRVQLPNNVAVGGREEDQSELYGFHRDTDDAYNHPLFEKNFIVPLTNAEDSASLYIEDPPNSRNFYCAKMKEGQFFNFDGGKCLHGNRPNRTGKTRISFDFRLVLKEDYDEEYLKVSKLTGKKFLIGEYYSFLEAR